MLDPDLRAYLTNAVPAVVGRIHPDVLPDPPILPALVYQRVTAPQDAPYDGGEIIQQTGYQIDVWSRTASERRTVADAVSAALVGYRGLMGATLVAIPRQSQGFDEHEQDTGLYRAMLQFVLWYQEV